MWKEILKMVKNMKWQLMDIRVQKSEFGHYVITMFVHPVEK